MITGERGLAFRFGRLRPGFRISEWMRSGFERASGGARTMRDRYSPPVVARRHLEIYREVLNSPGRGQGVIPL